jgi:hypothetical protein
MASEVMDVVLGESERYVHLSKPRWSDIALVDLYSLVLGQSALIDDIIRKTKSRVSGELRFQQELLALNGALDMVLAQAALGWDHFAHIDIITTTVWHYDLKILFRGAAGVHVALRVLATLGASGSLHFISLFQSRKVFWGC